MHTLNCSRNDHSSQLGDEVGCITSVPKTLQIAAIACGIGLFLGLWKLAIFGVFLAMVVGVSSILVVYGCLFLLPSTCTAMRIYQQGIEIAISGKRHTIPFATVSEVTTKITHVYMRNGNYLGSQIDLQLKVDEKYRVIQWSLEYRKGGRQERLLNAVLSNLASSVGERLKSELLEKGRLDWTANAHLTSDGLMIEDPFTHRFIHYEDIEECRLEESTLRIFRTSDVLPVFECRYDCPNASAYLYLLQLLSRSARKISTEMQMV